MEAKPFVDAHGVEVFSRWWPVEDPRGVVLIAHGASEHSGRYDRFATALNDAGFAAAALDHRGHGRTGAATGAGRTGPGGGAAVLDDLHELRVAVEAAMPSAPVFLFGHSLGALISIGYLAVHGAGLHGTVLCGVAADVDETGPLAEMLKGVADAGMADASAGDMLRAFNEPFEPARTPYDWLSRDPDEVDRYLADPYCGDQNPLTFGLLVDLFGVVAPARAAFGSIDHPILVIAGDQDPAAAMGAHATVLHEALRGEGVESELRLYEGARHELLNETNRDDVTADLLDWFARQLS